MKSIVVRSIYLLAIITNVICLLSLSKNWNIHQNPQWVILGNQVVPASGARHRKELTTPYPK